MGKRGRGSVGDECGSWLIERRGKRIRLTKI